MRIRPVAQKKDGRTKNGKGFSRGELREVGIDSKQALRLAIAIDLRRRTKHEENIRTLKHHLQGFKSSKTRKKRQKHAS